MGRQLGDAVLTYQLEKVNPRERIVACIRFVTILVLAIVMTLPFVIMQLPSLSENKEKVIHGNSTDEIHLLPSTFITNDSEVIVELQNMTNCSDDFYLDDNTSTCLPQCGKWTYTSHGIDKILTIATITGTVLGILVSTILLILSFILYKKMLKFPVILVVYTCISQLVSLCCGVVAQVDRENILCVSKNLKNLEEIDTTFYCRFLGATFVYIRLQVMMWWLFINGIMLYGVVRPLQYRSQSDSGKLKYVHLSFLAAGIGIPLIPVFICHWIGGYGIVVPLNYACLPRNKWATTYSLVLPVTICAIIGLSMLFIIRSELGKKRIISKESDIKTSMAGGEVKALILVSVFLFLYLFITITNAVFFWRADSISVDIQAHFECEAKGRQSGYECGRESFDSFHSIFFTMSSILSSNFVIVLVIFIVDFRSLGKRFL